ncbi:hypothetical protein ACWCQN_47925 [Streptomyces sp. NPDC001984]
MVPLTAAELGYALWNLPRLIETGLRSLTEQAAGTFSAFADDWIAVGLVGTLGEFMLLCPLVGAAYLCVRVTGGSYAPRSVPPRTTPACVGTLAATGALAAAWLGGMTPQPLPPKPPIVPLLQPGVPTLRTPDSPPAQTPQDDARPEPPHPTGPTRQASSPTPSPSALPSDEASTASASTPAQTQAAAHADREDEPQPEPRTELDATRAQPFGRYAQRHTVHLTPGQRLPDTHRELPRPPQFVTPGPDAAST